MADRLVVVVGRRPQFLPTRVIPQGCLSVPYDMEASFLKGSNLSKQNGSFNVFYDSTS